MELNRTAEQWQKCDPRAMAIMSEAAIMYAFQDARRDVLQMHAEIERLRRIETAALACDGIEMRYCYEVPVQAWEDLMQATWEGEITKPLTFELRGWRSQSLSNVRLGFGQGTQS
jgi:hypothetical protein